MSTKAQRWAQKRNWHKARLVSALSVCYNETLTKNEVEKLNKLKYLVLNILNTWDNNNPESKEHYLRNVKN